MKCRHCGKEVFGESHDVDDFYREDKKLDCVGVPNDGLGKCDFIPHNDGFPHLSRDWTDLDCKAACIYQKFNKCITPSKAEIGEDGRCKGFKAKVTKPEQRKDD